MAWHHVPRAELFVICDDVNLPLGHLRLREQGGAGGQKGLRSIIDVLGTDEFRAAAHRRGRGRSRRRYRAATCLSRFPKDLREAVDQAVSNRRLTPWSAICTTASKRP